MLTTETNLTNNTLFLGDLSVFVDENTIKELFESYGDIIEIRIKTGNDKKRKLGYGFIRFSTSEAASNAKEQLNGYVLHGRALRIGWATKSKLLSAGSNTKTAQILVSFVAKNSTKLISEDFLRQVFSRFGKVVDVTIKKTNIDPDTIYQAGYGFIHYENTKAGIESAQYIIKSSNNFVHDNVNFDCQMSDTLRALIKENEDNEARKLLYMNHNNNNTTIPYGSDSSNDYYANNNTNSTITKLPAHNTLLNYNKISIEIVIQVDFTVDAKRGGELMVENTLREVFSQFGPVKSANIRKSTLEPDTLLQRGNGYIVFDNNNEGVNAALNVINNNSSFIVNKTTYICHIDPSLKASLEAKIGNSGATTVANTKLERYNPPPLAMPTGGSIPTVIHTHDIYNNQYQNYSSSHTGTYSSGVNSIPQYRGHPHLSPYNASIGMQHNYVNRHIENNHNTNLPMYTSTDMHTVTQVNGRFDSQYFVPQSTPSDVPTTLQNQYHPGSYTIQGTHEVTIDQYGNNTNNLNQQFNPNNHGFNHYNGIKSEPTIKANPVNCVPRYGFSEPTQNNSNDTTMYNTTPVNNTTIYYPPKNNDETMDYG